MISNNLPASLFDFVSDRRIPATDVRGVLADFQIRKHHLDEIAKEVDKNWQGVCRVCIGTYNNHHYLAIQLEPFSRELQIKHWALRDIIENILGVNSFSFFYLPEIEKNQYSSEVIVYERR